MAYIKAHAYILFKHTHTHTYTHIHTHTHTHTHTHQCNSISYNRISSLYEEPR